MGHLVTSPGAERRLSSAIDQANTGLPERLDWRAVDALVAAVTPVIASLLTAAREDEREAVLHSLAEHEAELQRVRSDELDSGRIAGVQEAAYIVRARGWQS